MSYPKVLTELETLELLHQGRSIARYGDGELKLCKGSSIKCQPGHPDLARRLREILKSDSDCLVGIPRIVDRSFMTPQKQEFWGQFVSQTQFYEPKKVYASAFVTRPDSVPSLYTGEYFENVKALWSGRKVILINGDNRKMDKDPSLFDTAARYDRLECQGQNAWRQHERILEICKDQPKDTLFVLGLGPTATVLAYDLCQAGYQALDLGHIGMFYARYQEGKPFEFDKRKE
jgi:glycosyltransferase family protein